MKSKISLHRWNQKSAVSKESWPLVDAEKPVEPVGMASVSWVVVPEPGLDETTPHTKALSFEAFKKKTQRSVDDEPSVVDLINAALVSMSSAAIRYALDESEIEVMQGLRRQLYLMGPNTPAADVLEVHKRLKDLGIRIADFEYRSVDDSADLRHSYEAYLLAYQQANAAMRRDVRDVQRSLVLLHKH